MRHLARACAASLLSAIATVVACGNGSSPSAVRCGSGTTEQDGECVVAGDAASDGGTEGGTGVPSDAGPTDADATTEAAVGPNGCPLGRGPTMVAVPAIDGGTFCIDSTEVTNAQYGAFLADVDGGTVSQPSSCQWNASFVPDQADCPNTPYDPIHRADYPVACVNWCDAHAFCQWAGKGLCNNDGTSDNGWQRACSSGEQHAFVYGDKYQTGRCIDGTYDASRPVGSAGGCQSPDPSYAGVFDLIGNIGEWSSYCVSGTMLDASETECLVSGGAAKEGFDFSCLADGGFTNPPGEWGFQVDSFDYLGFRCCANQ